MSTEFSSVVLREAVNLYVDLASIAVNFEIANPDLVKYTAVGLIVAGVIYLQARFVDFFEG